MPRPQQPRRFAGRTSHQGSTSVERLRKELDGCFGDLDQLIASLLARVAALESADTGGGGGVVTDAQYLALAAHAGLSAERVFTPGTGLAAVDGGAGGLYTLNCTVSPTTTESIQDVVGTMVADSSSVTWAYNDPAGTLTASVPAEYVLYTVDYSTLPNNALSGTESLDGRNYTITNEGNATLLEILNGTGLHFDASTASTAFSSSSQTAPRVEISLTNLLGSLFNPSRRLRIDCRLASTTMSVNNNFFAFGMAPNASGFGNMGFAQKIRTGGATSSRHFGPGSSTTSVVTAAHDVFSLLVDDNEIRTYAAVWAGSYPELRDMSRLGASSASIGAAADADGFLQLGARLFFAFATGEAGGTMDVVVRELRVSEVH